VIHRIPTKKQFKRRRCDNCNRLYLPVRADQRFCRELPDRDKCRKEYWRYGSSYGPLKTGLRKVIEKKYEELLKEETRRYRALLAEVANQSRRIDRVEKFMLDCQLNVEQAQANVSLNPAEANTKEKGLI
jgi:hypothetical protein